MGLRRTTVGVLAAASTSVIITMASPVVGSSFTVTREVIDDRGAGDCTVLADLDGTGVVAVVNGGGTATGGPVPLRRYPTNGGAARTLAVPAEGRHFTGACAAADLDGDGDLDLVAVEAPAAAGAADVVWHENPGPADTPWAQHPIGTHPSGVPLDLVVARLDPAGAPTVVTRSTAALRRWAPVTPAAVTAPWQGLDVAVPGGRGLTAADVDGDGDDDLLAGGLLIESTGAGTWAVSDLAGTASGRSAVGDVTGDGRPDLVLGPADGPGPLTLHTGAPGARWAVTVVGDTPAPLVHLALADLDADGDLDVVGAAPFDDLRVWLSGHGRWDLLVLDPDGTGRFAVADVDGDGDGDLAGSNPAGNPPLVLFRNNGPTGRGARPGPPTGVSGGPTPTIVPGDEPGTGTDEVPGTGATPGPEGGQPPAATIPAAPSATPVDPLAGGSSSDLPGPLPGGRDGPSYVTGAPAAPTTAADDVVVLPERLARTRQLDVPKVVLALGGLLAFVVAWTLFGTPLRILPAQRTDRGNGAEPGDPEPGTGGPPDPGVCAGS